MRQPAAIAAPAPPLALRAAQVILFVQATVTALFVVVTVIDMVAVVRTGHRLVGMVYPMVLVSVVGAVLAFVAGFGLRRSPNYRVAALVVEAILILYGVINLVAGMLTGLAQLVFGVVMTVLLTRGDVGTWYARVQRLS